MTAIVGTAFDRAWDLASTLGVWEHPELGLLTACRFDGGVRMVHDDGAAERLSCYEWLTYFKGMPKGADAWRRATVSAKTSPSACASAR